MKRGKESERRGFLVNVHDNVLFPNSNSQSSSRDSFGQSRAEIDELIGPRMAVVIGPIALCLSDHCQADVDCREGSTDDVIMSLASPQR